jgi:predicted HTH domain antitoxin
MASNKGHEMTQLILDIPESAFSTLHQAPNEFAQEMRVAAAVKWYELERVSQGRAAEIAGLTRAAFIDALSRYRVSPFQYTAEELIEEMRDAD